MLPDAPPGGPPPTPVEVSVIVPAYESAGTIERALNSVARQTAAPGEVIVVDDGSHDDTAKAAEACRDRLLPTVLTVLQQENRGAGSARNRAIGASTGTVLAFLDADDEWLPPHLERSLAHMNRGGFVLTAHNGMMINAEGSESLIDGARRFREDRDPFVTLYRKGFIDTCTVLVRKDAVLAVGGFDETLLNAQDFELWLALLRQPGARFTVFDEPLCRYHVTPDSIMSHTARRLDCCLQVASRYAPDLIGRPGGGVVSSWFRVLAVYGEAVQSYRNRGRHGAMVATLFGLPLSIFRLSMDTLGRAKTGRRRFPSIPTGK